MILQLSNVRLAFAQLFDPATVQGEGEPAYSCSLLINPKDAQVAKINAVIDQVAKETWGAKADGVLKALRAQDKVCLHNGDAKANYNGFAGNLYVSCRSAVDKKPLVIHRDKTPLTKGDGVIYSGCYVNANIEVWAQDNKFGKRINAQIRGVQFYADGDSFGGGTVAGADEFQDLSSGADAEDLVA